MSRVAQQAFLARMLDARVAGLVCGYRGAAQISSGLGLNHGNVCLAKEYSEESIVMAAACAVLLTGQYSCWARF